MSNPNDKTKAFLKPHLWLIAFIGVFVPRRLRADWRQEWEAELRYRERLLAEWDRLDWRNKIELLRRSASAFFDALVLQPQRLEDEMFQDLRFGARMLLKHKGFTAVAALTLTLGIGANTAIFSVMNAVLFRPIPYPDSDRLVMVWATDHETRRRQDSTSFPDFTDWREQNQVFAHMAAYSITHFNMAGGNQPERVIGLVASADLFPVLGIAPVRGRAFLREEQQPGRNKVVLVSDNLWQRRFGRDPQLIGKTVNLNDEAYTVIGILPPGFQFTHKSQSKPELIVPFAPMADRGGGYLFVVGRLKPGATLEEAQSNMAVIARRLEQTYPETNKGRGVNLVPLHESLTGAYRSAILLLAGAVGLLLLIGCANVANLMLARGVGRRKELAVRAALGASRLRLLRQLMTESAILSCVSGVLALLLTGWGVKLLVALLSQYMPLGNVPIDRFVFGFALLISLLTAPIFGLAPALAVSRRDIQEWLKEGGRTSTGGLRHNRLRALLVISETALALTLLIGAGLMIKSFFLLQRVEPGFRTENLLTGTLSLSPKYAQPQARDSLLGEALNRVAGLPGVESAALVADLPFRSGTHETFSIAGRPDPAPRRGHPADFNVISPGYFRTMGIPLAMGRDFTPRDTRNAPGVAIINEAMRRRFWPDEDPIGKRIRLYYDPDLARWLSIVGVVGDVRRDGLNNDAKPEVFLPYLQDTHSSPMNLAIRSAFDPTGLAGLAASVERAVWAVDKEQPVSDLMTMEQIVHESVAQPRVLMLLLAAFAGLALMLAAVGIYGVMSYWVKQRAHEIGIRMALGAESRNVLWLVVSQGMTLTLIGVALGLFAAFALTRMMRELLFGVSATDPATFALIALLLVGVALIASYIPARRATKVDPLIALRSE